jgi:hypothetical protein
MKAHRSDKTLERGEYLSRARSMALRGQDLGQSKLNDDAIESIRSAQAQREKLRAHIKSTLSNEALASIHGVHVRTIEKVLSFETWVHI